VLSSLEVQQLETAELQSNFLCAPAIALNVNKFIKPVPAHKMKYLLKWHYSKHQLSKFLNTHGMLKRLYVNTNLPALLVPIQLKIFE